MPSAGAAWLPSRTIGQPRQALRKAKSEDTHTLERRSQQGSTGSQQDSAVCKIIGAWAGGSPRQLVSNKSVQERSTKTSRRGFPFQGGLVVEQWLLASCRTTGCREGTFGLCNLPFSSTELHRMFSPTDKASAARGDKDSSSMVLGEAEAAPPKRLDSEDLPVAGLTISAPTGVPGACPPDTCSMTQAASGELEADTECNLRGEYGGEDGSTEAVLSGEPLVRQRLHALSSAESWRTAGVLPPLELAVERLSIGSSSRGLRPPLHRGDCLQLPLPSAPLPVGAVPRQPSLQRAAPALEQPLAQGEPSAGRSGAARRGASLRPPPCLQHRVVILAPGSPGDRPGAAQVVATGLGAAGGSSRGGGTAQVPSLPSGRPPRCSAPLQRARQQGKALSLKADEAAMRLLRRSCSEREGQESQAEGSCGRDHTQVPASPEHSLHERLLSHGLTASSGLCLKAPSALVGPTDDPPLRHTSGMSSSSRGGSRIMDRTTSWSSMSGSAMMYPQASWSTLEGSTQFGVYHQPSWVSSGDSSLVYHQSAWSSASGSGSTSSGSTRANGSTMATGSSTSSSVGALSSCPTMQGHENRPMAGPHNTLKPSMSGRLYREEYMRQQQYGHRVKQDESRARLGLFNVLTTPLSTPNRPRGTDKGAHRYPFQETAALAEDTPRENVFIWAARQRIQNRKEL